MITYDVTFNIGPLEKLQASVKARAEVILWKVAGEIQAEAIKRTQRIDTGAMKSGWRVEKSAELQLTIYNTQEYAIYHELGTKRMSAMPMLSPGIMKYRQKLVKAWGELLIP